jgi:alpha-L-fucosidase 2
MLLQSHLSSIDILPALPAAIPDGNIKGIRAEVVLNWILNGKMAGLQH